MWRTLFLILTVVVIAAGGAVIFRRISQNESRKFSDDMVVIDQPLIDETIRSPLKVTGKARGTWFFEASFPVILTDWDGRIIAQAPAAAVGDWMTTDWVPFEAALIFENPAAVTSPRGALILRKDNPSGLPQYDDAREIQVFFAR